MINGELLINGNWINGRAGSWRAVNPVNATCIEPAMTMADLSQVREALQAAEAVSTIFADSSLEMRATFLRGIAERLTDISAQIVERYCVETGYPTDRAESELARTINQLYLYADYVLTGHHLDVRLDLADENRQPPKPDLRSMNIPLGPVAVFGAANFPLAYSVAGGDSVSALAAGCPILVKSHPSHPGTCELVARAVDGARKNSGLPAGIFALLHGEEDTVGRSLASAPEIKAVAFTGSFRGGMALKKIARQREIPIPVFAEMGSVNPIILLPEKLKADAKTIAEGFVKSATLHSGQYCVTPGLIIATESEALDSFVKHLKTEIKQVPENVMLNCRIHQNYLDRLEKLKARLFLVGAGNDIENDGYHAQSYIFQTTSNVFLYDSTLQEETFGPAAILVRCNDHADMMNLIEHLSGQLTASIHGSREELLENQKLMEVLRAMAGRVIINGFPTGVEVGCSTVHGGPFPATTDARFTSVGTNAIFRFLRPVCYQGCPDYLLPQALKQDNPLNIERRVGGKLEA